MPTYVVELRVYVDAETPEIAIEKMDDAVLQDAEYDYTYEIGTDVVEINPNDIPKFTAH